LIIVQGSGKQHMLSHVFVGVRDFDRALLIGAPYDGQPHEAGNGQMITLAAASRVVVERAYQVALASGGSGEGPPGLRPEYHAYYYGAYFRDPDGNKLCVVCHAPQGFESAGEGRRR